MRKMLLVVICFSTILFTFNPQVFCRVLLDDVGGGVNWENFVNRLVENGYAVKSSASSEDYSADSLALYEAVVVETFEGYDADALRDFIASGHMVVVIGGHNSYPHSDLLPHMGLSLGEVNNSLSGAVTEFTSHWITQSLTSLNFVYHTPIIVLNDTATVLAEYASDVMMAESTDSLTGGMLVLFADDHYLNKADWNNHSAEQLVDNLFPPFTPVVLSSFEVIDGPGFINIYWSTASEINCHRWEIYRGQREDGQYAKIGELPGHGSTETEHSYQWVDRQVTAGLTYFYKLKQVDFDGSATWSHVASATVGSAVPNTYAFHQNYPNPFNPVTEISYAIPTDEHVTLKVYNVAGEEVATLVDADQRGDLYTVQWDARDLSSGVYFCRLNAGEFSKTIKMVLLK